MQGRFCASPQRRISPPPATGRLRVQLTFPPHPQSSSPRPPEVFRAGSLCCIFAVPQMSPALFFDGRKSSGAVVLSQNIFVCFMSMSELCHCLYAPSILCCVSVFCVMDPGLGHLSVFWINTYIYMYVLCVLDPHSSICVCFVFSIRVRFTSFLSPLGQVYKLTGPFHPRTLDVLLVNSTNPLLFCPLNHAGKGGCLGSRWPGCYKCCKQCKIANLSRKPHRVHCSVAQVLCVKDAAKSSSCRRSQLTDSNREKQGTEISCREHQEQQ